MRFCASLATHLREILAGKCKLFHVFDVPVLLGGDVEINEPIIFNVVKFCWSEVNLCPAPFTEFNVSKCFCYNLNYER